MGLRVTGKNYEELLASGAQALLSLVADPEKISQDKDGLWIGFDLKAENQSELFLKWLREVLFNFAAKHFILADFQFHKLTEKSFELRARAIPYDPELHGSRCEVKAVTYHGFKFEQTKNGYLSEVIVDI